MDLKAATDEALLLGIQQQDVGALEELYDRHHRIALAVAYRVLHNRELAEDAVQEAFLGVWRRPYTYKPERGAAKTWLLTVVRHRAIDITRGRAFSQETQTLDERAYAIPSPDTWAQVDSRLERERIRNAMAQLPKEQRDAIDLAFFSGHTYQEVAQKTQAPLGTVKGRMRLGMQKLRSLLADVDGGEAY